jgi:hypothetical protein
MTTTKIVDRLYYVDASLDTGTHILTFVVRTVEEELFTNQERNVLWSAARDEGKSFQQPSDNLECNLEFQTQDVKDEAGALNLIRRVMLAADRRLIVLGISLAWDPCESTLTLSPVATTEKGVTP